MSDPQRLLEDGGEDLGRALLRSARADRPSPRARQRALQAMGVGGAIATASVTASGASAATTGAASLLKWIGGGVVSGILAVGGAHYAQQPAAPPPPRVKAVQPHASAGVTAATRAARPAPATEEPAPATEAPSPEPPSPAAPTRPTAPLAAAPKPATSALAEEVRLLDRAREAIAGGDADAALDALARRDQRFGGGALGPEATVLRIEARLQQGDRAGAARLARGFLAAHPQSPLAARVRTLLAAAGGGG